MRFKPLAIQVLQQVLLYALLFWLLVSVTRAGLTYYQGQQRLQQVANNVAELYLPFMEESGYPENADHHLRPARC